MDNLMDQGWLVLGLAAWVALSIGSFLNVVVHRLPIMLQRQFITDAKDVLDIAHAANPEPYNLAVPASHCPKCNHPIRPLENIPIVSWLVQRGRCKSCNDPISARYPLVEGVTLILSLFVIARFGFSPVGLAACVFTWLLVAATMIDADTMLLPDQLTLPLLWLGLITNLAFDFTPIASAISGAVIGYLLLWTTYWAFKLLTGKEGMGYGDFKLLAALGAWLGWEMLPAILLIASLSGLAWAIIRLVSKRMRRGDPMPFGPYLAVAGWICLMAGDSLSDLLLLSS
jgi:leader peptidase (prepilin peptidase) / N-methyltransferase